MINKYEITKIFALMQSANKKKKKMGDKQT